MTSATQHYIGGEWREGAGETIQAVVSGSAGQTTVNLSELAAG